MAKSLYIVPRWGGNSRSDFYNWLKQQFEKSGINIVGLDPPEPNAPTIASWTKYLTDHLSSVDSSSVIMAHSVGCLALLKCLSDSTRKPAAILLVGAWFEVDNPWDSLKPWLSIDLDYHKIKSNCPNIHVVISDNDRFTSNWKKTQQQFEERLGATVKLAPGRNHFNASEEPDVMAALQNLLAIAITKEK